jgi:hypothetical protein
MDFVKFIEQNFNKIVEFNKVQTKYIHEQFPQHKWLTTQKHVIIENYTLTNNGVPMIYIEKLDRPSSESFNHSKSVIKINTDAVGLFRIGGVFHTHLNMFCWPHNLALGDKSLMYDYKDKYDNFKFNNVVDLNQTLYSVCMAIQYMTGADLVCFCKYKSAVTYELLIIHKLIQ